MNSARDVILGRIRAAIGGTSSRRGFQQDTPRGYRRRGTRNPRELLDLLHARIEDYQALVVRSGSRDLPENIARRLASREATRVVVPPDLPDAWLEEGAQGGLEVSRDSVPRVLSKDEVSSAQAVLTGCALAIAETGTLIMNGGAGQGRRALTLLPDYHLCVVFAHQVVETVPEAVDAMKAMDAMSHTEAGKWPPLTLISGPSATSDIELIRVEGVHGPRTLDVILVEDQ